MGILQFYSEFVAKYNSGNPNDIPRYVSGLCIDLNYLIHDTVGQIYATAENTPKDKVERVIKKLETDAGKDELEKAFQVALWDKIMELVKLFQPHDYLVLAVDGVAPMAKISQQRTRRYKSQIEAAPTAFNPIKISPGTIFMRNLDTYLRDKISDQRANLALKVIYSSHLVPGEGEHKILDYFREKKLPGSDMHVVIGNDADLVPLLMGLKLPRLVIYRGKDFRGIKPLVYIDRFRERLLLDLGVLDLSGRIKNNHDEAAVINDLILLIILIGNDFLPPMPGLNLLPRSMDALLKCYRKMLEDKRYLTIGGQIMDDNFKAFLQLLKEEEINLLVQVRLSDKILVPIVPLWESTEVAETRVQINYDDFKEIWWSQFLPVKLWSSKLPPIFEDLVAEADIHPKSQVLSDYYNSLKWTLNYYLLGTYAINLNWNYPWYYAPTISDLAKYKPKDNPQWSKAEYSFNTLHQLLVIVPPKYKNIIPRPVRPLISGALKDIAPEKFTINKEGIIFANGGTPILPFINPYRIIYEVNKIKLDNDTIAAYSQADDIIFEAIPKEISRRDVYLNIKKKLRNEIRSRGRGRGGYRGRGFNPRNNK